MKSFVYEFRNAEFGLGFYNFNGLFTVRVLSDAQLNTALTHNLLFEAGEVSAKCVLHSWANGKESGVWVERLFKSRREALAFVWRQSVRFGFTKWFDANKGTDYLPPIAV